MFAAHCNKIFDKAILEYHQHDNVDELVVNPFTDGSIDFLLYQKNWIDTVQWHLEDIIRNPEISPEDGLALKRRIDASNQVRTDIVEYIDSYFLDKYKDVQALTGACLNTESPAWAIDRLSILALKIYHMRQEAERAEASEVHRSVCSQKLAVLLEQRNDLSQAINTLMQDIENGRKYMKAYKQMKMYNDESLNPILYNQPKK
ncbi:MAG: DUF4254 domain-containing protein [Ferruginibacter sp.]